MDTREKPGNAIEGLALTAVFFAASVTGLALLPVATRFGPPSAGWWTQPWLMPAFCLALLAFANGITLLRAWLEFRTAPRGANERREAAAAVLGWFRPLEFYLYFLGYIWLLGKAGYFLSTLVFVIAMCLRTGLASLRWLALGALAALALTAIFRWGLGIWIPAAALYDLFPDGLRRAFTVWM